MISSTYLANTFKAIHRSWLPIVSRRNLPAVTRFCLYSSYLAGLIIHRPLPQHRFLGGVDYSSPSTSASASWLDVLPFNVYHPLPCSLSFDHPPPFVFDFMEFDGMVTLLRFNHPPPFALSGMARVHHNYPPPFLELLSAQLVSHTNHIERKC
ncbi:hypothetical protein COLO4_11986 [Corchorus olitorius]|uniref:Uncharacterized protein n=1 Tax=Corchorus olitorius TaxID=93759 RepID=A0A1R3K2K3_9ROSI|nr:hypothetical protein COLO4_11986 [Corchorus olitorius]